MTDVKATAAAIAQSMFAMAKETGVLEKAGITASPELIAHAEESLARAYESLLGQGPLECKEPSVSAGGEVITAQACFWGWRLNVPHSQVEPLLNGSEVVSKIIEIGLDVIPEIGEILGLVVGLYVKVLGAIIRAVDKGNGVYLNQSWLVEAGIILSGGILAGPALAAAFIPTTR